MSEQRWIITEARDGGEPDNWSDVFIGTLDGAWGHVGEMLCGVSVAPNQPTSISDDDSAAWCGTFKLTNPDTAEVTYWVDSDDGPELVESTITVWEA